MTIVSRNATSIAPKTYTINSGKGTVIGPVYQIGKQIARVYGYYDTIKPYLPENIISEYRTKAIKTGKYKYSTFLAGSNFASKKFQKKKSPGSSSCKQQQKSCISRI